MNIDYLNPIHYYYGAIPKPTLPPPIPKEVNKAYRPIEPIASGKLIDKYA
jgi:hypothetical protein